MRYKVSFSFHNAIPSTAYAEGRKKLLSSGFEWFDFQSGFTTDHDPKSTQIWIVEGTDENLLMLKLCANVHKVIPILNS